MAVELSAEDFERLVNRAVDGIPAALWSLIENCVILVEDAPPPGSPALLGLYDGVPLTERDNTYAGALPDRILIFRLPLLSICETYAEVIEEIHITVVHEIAHHFGIDDARLHDLGYA